ncbi:MAG: YabP/YqfC family sporulation protein [Clostridia bacterium]|nr:YabP/YqfC family sporulation protein [Clostridia bacterium]MBO5300367.1 YabP/YqfC family sporulation protein [Clostridia bacterium]
MKNKRERKAKKQEFKGLQTEFYSNTQVTFENPCGVEILEYNTETVRIGSEKSRVRIYGSGLDLGHISPQCVMVRGKITSLEFE